MELIWWAVGYMVVGSLIAGLVDADDLGAVTFTIFLWPLLLTLLLGYFIREWWLK